MHEPISQRCPKCGHARRPAEAAPEWQCPACGVACCKAEQAAARPVTSDVRAFARPQRRLGLAMWLFAALALAGVFLALPPAPQPVAHAVAGQGGQPEVVLYATAWCGYCAKTRAFFARHGIAYVERDIERDAGARQDHGRLGGRGVPLIVVGNQVVRGYSEREMARLLGPWMR